MERIYGCVLNSFYKMTGRVSDSSRDAAVFLCLLIITSVFSLNPRNVDDGRRMIFLSIIALIMIVFCADRKVKQVRLYKPLFIPLLLFAAGMIIISFLHPVGEGYLTYAIDIIAVFPLIYIVQTNNNDSRHMTDMLTAAVILSGLAAFVFAIYKYLTGEYWVFSDRAVGATGNPNYYGMIGLAVMMASLYMIVRMRRHPGIQIAAATCLGIAISMMVRSVSRAAVLSAISCILILFIYVCKKLMLSRMKNVSKGILVKGILLILLVVASAYLGLAVQVKVPMESAAGSFFDTEMTEAGYSFCYTVYAEGEETDDTAEHVLEGRLTIDTDLDTYGSGRISLWKAYIEHLNMTGNDYEAVKDEWFTGLTAQKAHNNFLDYAFRFGIPVGILYAVFYIIILVKTAGLLFGRKPLMPENLWSIMVVSSYALYSMVEVSSLPFTRYIPCLFFLSIGSLMCDKASQSMGVFRVAPGVSEMSLYLSGSDDNNVKVHALKINKNSRVKVIAGYSKGMAEGMPEHQSSLTSIVKAYNESHKGHKEVVAASSGDFFSLKTGRPCGALIANGTVMHKQGRKPFFAVCNDGSAVIRKARGHIDDAVEAIGGRDVLLYKGKVKVKRDTDKHPRQAIGICKDESLMIVNVEGRQPDSEGISMHDLALFMKSAGCVDALNLDGGGSAGFMTKHRGDDEPVMRNVPGDGYERSISSAILVVNSTHKESLLKAKKTGKPVKPTYSAHAVSMSDRDTYLDKTLSGRYVYTRNGLKPSGVFNIDGNAYLFKDGKGLTDAIRIGETEYDFKRGIYTGSSDPEAGEVVFGYCGADDNGRNLIFALHKGNWLLNIGLNPAAEIHDKAEAVSGEMEDWSTTQESCLPWYAFRHRIKSVYIADGVTSIGSRFLYMPVGKVKVSTETPLNELKYVRLPDSLRYIGEYAFYNKPLLEKVVLPSGDVRFGTEAFDTGVILAVKHYN